MPLIAVYSYFALSDCSPWKPQWLPGRAFFLGYRTLRVAGRGWCYTHSAPQPAATILATMPTDAALENAWYQACQTRQAAGTIPGWGDAICWNELHHTTPYHNTWD